jgi:1-acyl-sn-glycerol-3-phosphate acyltransferase
MSGAVIVASNHIAYLDPPVIGASVLREAHFAAKAVLFKHPILKPLITYLNAFPVRRTGFDNQALKNSLKALNSGGLLVIFPEGTRSRIGEMLPFKRGVGYLAAKTKAAVLPAYISGTNRLKQRLFKPGGITVKFGKPLRPDFNLANDETVYEKITALVQKAVKDLKG